MTSVETVKMIVMTIAMAEVIDIHNIFILKTFLRLFKILIETSIYSLRKIHSNQLIVLW